MRSRLRHIEAKLEEQPWAYSVGTFNDMRWLIDRIRELENGLERYAVLARATEGAQNEGDVVAGLRALQDEVWGSSKGIEQERLRR